MFEQSVLHPDPVRGWAVTLGFAGQLLVVTGVLMAPLIWPQLLPHAETTTWISAPAPPPPLLKEAPLPHVRPTRPWDPNTTVLYPPVESRRPIAVFDAPPAPDLAGVEGGTSGGESARGLFDSVVRPVTPKPAVELPVAATEGKAVPAPTQRIRVGGPVQAARLLHRVDPIYPPIARQTRVSGTVELTGVIGTDGRIRELRVASGHPFLVKAALEAVREWVYQPTLLGAEPVEVITTITVIFRLN